MISGERMSYTVSGSAVMGMGLHPEPDLDGTWCEIKSLPPTLYGKKDD